MGMLQISPYCREPVRPEGIHQQWRSRFYTKDVPQGRARGATWRKLACRATRSAVREDGGLAGATWALAAGPRRDRRAAHRRLQGEQERGTRRTRRLTTSAAPTPSRARQAPARRRRGSAQGVARPLPRPGLPRDVRRRARVSATIVASLLQTWGFAQVFRENASAQSQAPKARVRSVQLVFSQRDGAVAAVTGSRTTVSFEARSAHYGFEYGASLPGPRQTQR